MSRERSEWLTALGYAEALVLCQAVHRRANVLVNYFSLH